MESNSNGLSYSAGREVLRRVIWKQEMLLIAQLVLCCKKKKKKEVPFAYHQSSLPKIAENPASEWPSVFPGKYESVEHPSGAGHPGSQWDGFYGH